jgi:hypothetical protein
MSHGALPNIIDTVVDVKDLCAKYPKFKAAHEAWAAVCEQYDLSVCFKNEHAEDVSSFPDLSFCDDFGPLDDDAYEAESQRIKTAFVDMLAALVDEAGLRLCVTYAGEAEDSYADVKDEWVYYITNVWQPLLKTPEFEASGLKVKSVQWCVYG